MGQARLITRRSATTMRPKERTLERLQTELEGAQLSKVEGEDEKKGERAMMVVTCC